MLCPAGSAWQKGFKKERDSGAPHWLGIFRGHVAGRGGSGAGSPKDMGLWVLLPQETEERMSLDVDLCLRPSLATLVSAW